MKSKKRLLENSRLYVIIDKKFCANKSLLTVATEIKNGGADIIQLRDKEAKKERILQDVYVLRKLLSNSKTIFIVNDFLDVAKILDCDGIHLGQDDLSITMAKKILGEDKIIGVSCHNLIQVLKAQDSGADYVSIGPVFPTSTKPEYKTIGLNLIKEVKSKIKIPFFVIGGINLNNINQVLTLGAERIAVCGAVCKAKNILLATKKLSECINQ